MFDKSFEEMGIPPGYGFKKLLFCAAADTLIVQTQPVHGWRPDRLYLRRNGDERYEPIGVPEEMISQEDPAISSSHSLLAYNTIRWAVTAESPSGEWPGGNWEAVRVLDLATKSETHIVDRETLHIPDREAEVWIAHLLAFTEKPECLHVVAAFTRDERRTINHYVSELHLSSGLIRPLANLPAVFL